MRNEPVILRTLLGAGLAALAMSYPEWFQLDMLEEWAQQIIALASGFVVSGTARQKVSPHDPEFP